MVSPVWISHRGYCHSATENSAAAFEAALKLGFTHLETDLRTTADGHLVLAHDDDLSRVASTPVKVTQSTRSKLEALSLNRGEPILFFDQWLEQFGGWNWILDIKPEQGHRTVEQLLKWGQTSAAAAELLNERVRFLFWNKAQKKRLQSHWPEARCMATIGQCRLAAGTCLAHLPNLGTIRTGTTYSLPPTAGGVRILNPTIVERYQRQGARVLGYLPETELEARWALDAGVDEILTNHGIPSFAGGAGRA